MIKTQTVPCNLCGSKNYKHAITAHDRLHGVEGIYQYVRCNNCGLLYMNPQICPEDIPKLYPENYTPHLANNAASKKSLLQRKLENFLEPAKIPQSLANMITRDSQILDVGCGSGDFLRRVKQDFHCKTFGLDISENAVASARQNSGAEIFCGRLFDAPFETEAFDIITTWWVVEHMPNVNEHAEKIRSLLKPGGYWLFSVPNSQSFNAKAFKNRWYHLDCPRHLCIYSPCTIRQLLKSHNFQLNSIRQDKKPWGIIGSLQYAFYGDNFTPKTQNKLSSSNLLRFSLLPWTMIMAALRFSDNLIIAAQKPK